MTATFKPFPKIARLSREIVVTEKLDGTNAQVIIGEDGSFACGSRNRLITPEDDNHGFAAWAYAHKDELMKLGPGNHYGEWWGCGIQRGYGLREKRFSLFNVDRWSDEKGDRPACCLVVPTLYRGPFEMERVIEQFHLLAMRGSYAAPGFMKPEGIVVYHTAARVLFKKTFEADATGKEAQC